MVLFGAHHSREIFQKTNLEWLKNNGHLIESHTNFKNKTNVEFVWTDNTANKFNVLVYERGCGITLACSSGAAEITQLLFNLHKICAGKEIVLHMPGGKIDCSYTTSNQIQLHTTAKLVFQATFTN